MRSRATYGNQITVVLRFQWGEREVFRFVEQSGNFCIVLPSAGLHYTYHASGQGQFTVEREENGGPKCFVTARQPTSKFRGVELALGTSIGMGQFVRLREYRASDQQALILDADAALFRDEIVFVRVFLMEPNLEPEIPRAVNVGPKLVHVVKNTNPWVGIAFFQETVS